MGAHANHGESRVLVQLDCSCSRLYPPPAPRTGDMVWCPRHGVEAEVVSGVTVYRFQCRACRYARSYGKHIETPRKRASSHIRTHPTHVVALYNGQKFVEDISQENMSALLELPANHTTQLRKLANRYQNVTFKPHDKVVEDLTTALDSGQSQAQAVAKGNEDHHSAGPEAGMKDSEDHEGFPF